jgi:hypothetical protein
MKLRRWIAHWKARRILKKIGYCPIHARPLINGQSTQWCDQCRIDYENKRRQLAEQAWEMLKK